MFLGSQNLSKPAWGELQKNDSQLLIRSYEIGVLFLPSVVAEALGTNKTVNFIGSHTGNASVVEKEDSVEVSFPVPCKVPPQQYTQQDRKWIWDLEYKELDVCGLPFPRGDAIPQDYAQI